MIVNKELNNLEVEGADPGGFKATIDPDKFAFIIDILSNRQYKDPIGSIVREITSNCFDAHIEAEVDEPVIINFGEDTEGRFIEFIDVGIGMTPERARKFMSFGSSTKSLSNDQIGGFGLGGKSPLSYSDSYYLTTKKDGIEYQYVIFKDKELPQMDLLFSEPTLDRNGTTIKIYFKQVLDEPKFIEKCKEQLKYFDNVVFRGTRLIDNNYKIYEGIHFKLRSGTTSAIPRNAATFRSTGTGTVSGNIYYTTNSTTYNYPDYTGFDDPYINKGDEMHLVIGKVTYPIDWKQLKISPINIPIAIKFDIGELVVTQEREGIRYISINGKETADIIKEKIELVKRELVIRYKKESPASTNDIKSFIEMSKHYPLLIIGSEVLNLHDLGVKKNIVLEGFEEYQDIIDEKCFRSWKLEYDVLKRNGKGGRDYEREFDFDMLNRIIYENKSGRKNIIKNDYLLTKHEEFRIGKIKFDEFKRFNDRLRDKVKSIKELRDLKNRLETYLRKNILSYEQVTVPKDYTQKFSKVRLKRKEGEITVVDWNGPKTRSYILASFLRDHVGFTIYGYEEDEHLLSFFTQLFLNSRYPYHKAVKIFKITESNTKHFAKIKNSIYVKDFISDNKVFKHFATSLLIKKERKYLIGREFNKHGFNFEMCMSHIFPDYAFTFKEVQKFVVDYGGKAKVDEAIKESIIETALQFNLIDKDIYTKHKKLNNYVNKLDLLEYTMIISNKIHLIVDFLVLKGKKVDTIWTKPEQWEIEFVKETVEKINYLENVNKYLEPNDEDVVNAVFYESLNKYYNYVKAA